MNTLENKMVQKLKKILAKLLPDKQAIIPLHPLQVWRVLKTKSILLVRYLRRRTSRRQLYIAGSAVFILLVMHAGFFYWPRTTNFSYSRDNCFTSPAFLPGMIDQKQSPTFAASLDQSFKIANYPLYSHRTCISPVQAPKVNNPETIALSVGGNALLKKNIRVVPDEPPKLERQTAIDSPVPTNDPLIFSLSETDKVFDYKLRANKKEVDCYKQDRRLSCDTTGLQLTQSKRYKFELLRLFKNIPDETVFDRDLPTVQNVQIVKSSITAGQTIYNAPKNLTLTLNRPAETIDQAKLYLVADKKKQELPAKATIKDKTVTVSFDKPLPRRSTLVVEIKDIKAADKGHLNKPYSLRFQTSGGPKVLGASIGGYKLHPSGSIVLTFDSNLSAKQNVATFMSLQANGKNVPASISASGRTVVITPVSALPRCGSFTVGVLDGLQNEFGISGGSAWQYSGRVLCQTVFSIGGSVLGRGITAYSFGSGPSKIIFVGTTHGDEQSSTYLLNSWVAYLESNSDRIPANRTIIVIPSLNPDGYASSRRTNAHNVDLNRNFPANDWKRSVTMPGGSVNPNGGGSAPLSEPESRALANYVLSQSPKLVLTYHATGGVVVPNNSGNSQVLAGIYDQQSNVYQISKGASKGFFNYDTTGAFEDWLYDRVGIPCLLIELWTKSGYEFDSHANAMWSMINN